jgi:hypothetical protein
MSVQGRRSELRRWLEYLAAVLAGNAIYFYFLLPRVPEAWQHQIFHIDMGLMVDFLTCVFVYGVSRLVGTLLEIGGEKRGEITGGSESKSFGD